MSYVTATLAPNTRVARHRAPTHTIPWWAPFLWLSATITGARRLLHEMQANLDLLDHPLVAAEIRRVPRVQRFPALAVLDIWRAWRLDLPAALRGWTLKSGVAAALLFAVFGEIVWHGVLMGVSAYTFVDAVLSHFFAG